MKDFTIGNDAENKLAKCPPMRAPWKLEPS